MGLTWPDPSNSIDTETRERVPARTRAKQSSTYGLATETGVTRLRSR